MSNENLGEMLGKDIKDNSGEFKDQDVPENVIPLHPENGDSSEKQDQQNGDGAEHKEDVPQIRCGIQIVEHVDGKVTYAVTDANMTPQDALALLAKGQLSIMQIGLAGYVEEFVKNGLANATTNILQEVSKMLDQGVSIPAQVGEIGEALPEMPIKTGDMISGEGETGPAPTEG